MKTTFQAGAGQVDITPKDSQFLFGYPHVRRYSTGVHDRLWSSALYLCDGQTQVIFVGNDIVFVSKDIVRRVREKIECATGVPAGNIMVTATHTHSGPNTVNHISNEADPVVPKADENYVKFLEDGIVQAAIRAFESVQDAKAGLAIADDTGVGTNRRAPDGPADHNAGVLMVKSLDDKNIACMVICSMHPTVLHEDSTLISGDFPGLSRVYLQDHVLGKDCAVLHHTGPCGNQSPRHVTMANTFQEATRLGEILGKAVEKALATVEYNDVLTIDTEQRFIDDLPKKIFPTVIEAEAVLEKAVQKLEHLRQNNAAAQEIRTAECDWFGAEESLTLAKAAEDGRLDKTYQRSLPAEIQVVKIGPWKFVGWPGECFVEYPLMVKNKCKDTFVISLANGELQGYIVTKEAFEQGGYEAANGLFSYQSGEIFVNKTLEILKDL